MPGRAVEGRGRAAGARSESTRTLTGVIALVQEYRFRLVTDEGRWELFVLAHDAPLEGRELQTLQRSRTRVAVRYVDADDLIAGIARDVIPIGGR